MQKKENEKFREDIAEYKRIIEEKKKDEEPIDLATYFKNKDENDGKSSVSLARAPAIMIPENLRSPAIMISDK